MKTRLFTVAAVLLLSVGLTRCSLLIHQCDTRADCADDLACVEGFCVNDVVPALCRGNPDAGILAVYGAADAGDAIRLGTVIPVTNTLGEPSESDVQELNAQILAVEQVNSKKIGGRELALHVCDSQADPEKVAALTTYLTDTVGAKAVIVANSSGIFAAEPVTHARDVLLASANATSPEISALNNPDGGPRLVWRTAPSDAIQGSVIADLLLGVSPFNAGISALQQIAVVYVNDAYGQGLSTIIFTKVHNVGGRVVQTFAYDRGQADITGLVTQLDAFNPDITILVAFPDDGGRIVTEAATRTNLQRAAPHQWFLADAAKDPAIVSAELEGTLGTAPAKGAGIAYGIFANDYRARFPGKDPDGYAFIEHDYDLVYVLSLGAASALGSTGTGTLTGSAIAEGLTRLSSDAGTTYELVSASFTNARTAVQNGESINVEGASGHLDFDATRGEAPGSIEIWQVDAGVIRVLQRAVDPQ